MKKIISFMVIGMLAYSLFAGSNKDREYSPGTRTQTEYTSEWLGLKYTLNDDMVMAKDDEINSMMGIIFSGTASKLFDIDTVWEMVAMNVIEGTSINIIAEKLFLSEMTEEQYIKATQVQLKKLGAIIDDEITTRTVCGIDFLESNRIMTSYNINQNQMMLIKKINNRMAIITLTAFSQEGLDTLLKGFSVY